MAQIQDWLSPQSMSIIQEAEEDKEKDLTYMGEATELAKAARGDAFEFTQEPGSPDRDMNRMLTSFEMKNPIDLSIDPSRVTMTGQVSPTNAKFSKIGGSKERDFSQFCDDPNIMNLLMEDGQ